MSAIVFYEVVVTVKKKNNHFFLSLGVCPIWGGPARQRLLWGTVPGVGVAMRWARWANGLRALRAFWLSCGADLVQNGSSLFVPPHLLWVFKADLIYLFEKGSKENALLACPPPTPLLFFPSDCWRQKLSSGAHETQARALPQSRTPQPVDLSGRFQINLLLYLGHLFRDERRGEASPLRSVRDQFLRWGKRPRMWARQPCGFFCSCLLNSQATRFVSPSHGFPVK